MIEKKKDKEVVKEVPAYDRLHNIHQDKIQKQIQKV